MVGFVGWKLVRMGVFMVKICWGLLGWGYDSVGLC